MRRTLLAVTVGLAALTWSRSGVAQAPCLIERGQDPLDVVNTSVRHNVWILLDTSGSMSLEFDPVSQPGVSRLDAAKSSLNRILNRFVDAAGRPQFNWGFVNFASNPNNDQAGACTDQFTNVCAGLNLGELIPPPACGGDNRQTIRDRIAALLADGWTPNGISEDQLSQEIVNRGFVSGLLKDQKNFIIHVTDGDDTCECNTQVWTPTPSPPFASSAAIPAELRGGTATFDYTGPIVDDPLSDSDEFDRAAANAGTKGRLAYERLNPAAADRAGALKGDVFVIGMGLEGPSPSRAHHLAWEGSGAAYNRVGRSAVLANNPAELDKALEDALAQIGVPPSTITLGSPVVGTVKERIRDSDPTVAIADIEKSTAVRAANRNNVLLTATVEVPGFRGHLIARKVFNVVNDPGPPPRRVKQAAFSDPPLWDAGLQLQARDPEERTIFFNRNGETILRSFTVGVITPADLGVKQGYLKEIDGTGALSDADAAEMVVKVIRGYRLSVDPATKKLYRSDGSINFSNKEADGTTNTWKLFDATHGGPTLVLNPPRAPGDDPPAAFADRYARFFRDRFNRQTMVYLPTNGGMMHAFRADNGAELYAYIPDDVLGLGGSETPGSRSTLKDLVSLLVAQRNGITNHVFLLAGPVNVDDVFLQSVDDWRTVIAFGRGRGGKFFTALDVSDIGDWDGNLSNNSPTLTGLQVPKLLFNVGNREGVDDGDYDGLGETWSSPALGHVGNETDPQAVLLAGSGYGCKDTTEGRFFFVLRLEDGTILRRFGPIGSDAGAAVPNSLAASPLAYNPHAFDPQKIKTPDKVTRTFIGDLQGNVWKLDSFDQNPSNWVFDVFFSLGLNQPITAPADVLADRFNENQIFVFVGTGGDQRVKGQFVMAGIVDPGPDGVVGTGVPIRLASGDPFIVGVPPEERVFVAPATAPTPDGKGAVFFASSKSTFQTSTCTVRFTSTLFGFQATTGLGAFDADPATGEGGTSQIDLGEGKVTGLYHRDEHLYVGRSGGVGVDAATEVIGEDTFPSEFITGGLQVLVDGFRLSPF